jgi:hypothetical protein
VRTFPSPAGSIPGIKTTCEPVSVPVMRPISCWPGLLVNEPPEELMRPFRLGRIPARYVYGYARPPSPTVTLLPKVVA